MQSAKLPSISGYVLEDQKPSLKKSLPFKKSRQDSISTSCPGPDFDIYSLNATKTYTTTARTTRLPLTITIQGDAKTARDHNMDKKNLCAPLKDHNNTFTLITYKTIQRPARQPDKPARRLQDDIHKGTTTSQSEAYAPREPQYAPRRLEMIVEIPKKPPIINQKPLNVLRQPPDTHPRSLHAHMHFFILNLRGF